MLNFIQNNLGKNNKKIIVPIFIGVMIIAGIYKPLLILCIALIMGFFLFYRWLSNNPEGLLYFLILILPLNTLITILLFNFLGIQGTTLKLVLGYKDLLLFTVIILRLTTLNKQRFSIEKDYLPLIFAGAGFFLFEVLYVIFPIGPATFVQKLYALRTDTWYVLFLFMGILIPKINYEKIMKFILILSVIFTLVAVIEKLFNPIPLLVWLGYPKYIHYTYGGHPLTSSGLPYTYWASGGIRRMGSLLLNPLDYSAFILFSFPTILIVKKNKVRLLFAVLQVIGVLLSVSRTATVILLIEIFILLYWSYPHLNRLIIKVSACLGIIILSFIIFVNKLRTYVIDTITFRESSARGHLEEWTHAITKIIENPFGSGLSTAGITGAKANILYGGENQYLIMAVQLGVLGLIIFITFLFFTLRAILRFPYQNEKKWMFIVILVLIISGLTQQSFLNITITFISFTLIGNIMKGDREKVDV